MCLPPFRLGSIFKNANDSRRPNNAHDTLDGLSEGSAPAAFRARHPPVHRPRRMRSSDSPNHLPASDALEPIHESDEDDEGFTGARQTLPNDSNYSLEHRQHSQALKCICDATRQPLRGPGRTFGVRRNAVSGPSGLHEYVEERNEASSGSSWLTCKCKAVRMKSGEPHAIQNDLFNKTPRDRSDSTTESSLLKISCARPKTEFKEVEWRKTRFLPGEKPTSSVEGSIYNIGKCDPRVASEQSGETLVCGSSSKASANDLLDKPPESPLKRPNQDNDKYHFVELDSSPANDGNRETRSAAILALTSNPVQVGNAIPSAECHLQNGTASRDVAYPGDGLYPSFISPSPVPVPIEDQYSPEEDHRSLPPLGPFGAIHTGARLEQRRQRKLEKINNNQEVQYAIELPYVDFTAIIQQCQSRCLSHQWCLEHRIQRAHCLRREILYQWLIQRYAAQTRDIICYKSHSRDSDWHSEDHEDEKSSFRVQLPNPEQDDKVSDSLRPSYIGDDESSASDSEHFPHDPSVSLLSSQLRFGQRSPVALSGFNAQLPRVFSAITPSDLPLHPRSVSRFWSDPTSAVSDAGSHIPPMTPGQSQPNHCPHAPAQENNVRVKEDDDCIDESKIQSSWSHSRAEPQSSTLHKVLPRGPLTHNGFTVRQAQNLRKKITYAWIAAQNHVGTSKDPCILTVQQTPSPRLINSASVASTSSITGMTQSDFTHPLSRQIYEVETMCSRARTLIAEYQDYARFLRADKSEPEDLTARHAICLNNELGDSQINDMPHACQRPDAALKDSIEEVEELVQGLTYLRAQHGEVIDLDSPRASP